jgi:hypothetical protein
LILPKATIYAYATDASRSSYCHYYGGLPSISFRFTLKPSFITPLATRLPQPDATGWRYRHCCMARHADAAGRYYAIEYWLQRSSYQQAPPASCHATYYCPTLRH